MHRSMYRFPPGKGNRREINVKQRKDGVQCIEACHRGWKRWSSLLAEMTRRPEPVGENRSRAGAGERSRRRGEQEQRRVVKGNVETKRLPAVPAFFGVNLRDRYMRDLQGAYKACNLNNVSSLLRR